MEMFHISTYSWKARFNTIVLFLILSACSTATHFSSAFKLDCVSYSPNHNHRVTFCNPEEPMCYFLIGFNISDRSQLFFPEKAKIVKGGCQEVEKLGFQKYQDQDEELLGIRFICNTDKCNNMSSSLIKDEIHDVLRPYRLAIMPTTPRTPKSQKCRPSSSEESSSAVAVTLILVVASISAVSFTDCTEGQRYRGLNAYMSYNYEEVDASLFMAPHREYHSKDLSTRLRGHIFKLITDISVNILRDNTTSGTLDEES